MADAAVFEIFVYKNGQINTFMSIHDSLLPQQPKGHFVLAFSLSLLCTKALLPEEPCFQTGRYMSTIMQISGGAILQNDQ